MKDMDVYESVRRFVMIEGGSRRAAARLFGIDRKTVDKCLAFSAPPGYRLGEPRRRPKIGPYLGVIEAILAADVDAPVKQRHTAKRIWERLRDEHGFTGSYERVKEVVREHLRRRKEAFVPLAHPPGHAQVDFGEAHVIIAGVRCKAHFFCMDLPHSDACFVKAYPAETTEAFLDGHVSAFAFFGGVPRSILYDNTKIAVARITGAGERVPTLAFTGLKSHFLFESRFGRPGKGNDKGKVEGLVKFARRNFMTPIQEASSFEELNARLAEHCRRRQSDSVAGAKETIGARMAADQAAFRSIPAGLFEPCDKRPGRVSSTSVVRYRSNDYSVPTRFAHCEVMVKGFVDRVVITCQGEIAADHPRSYESGDFVANPLHYLALIEQKPGALDQAKALQGWDLPACFTDMRRLMEARMKTKGRREYIQVLRLLEIFQAPIVAAAVEDAIRLNVISFDAVKQLAVAKVEKRAPALSLEQYPFLPRADVRTTRASDYMALINRSAA
ncbi:MAG: IS21 family transposase [Alphaproteobacteria bacterium]|nr:IS21 family transposase [Alphaproteobacteria bacterium]